MKPVHPLGVHSPPSGKSTFPSTRRPLGQPRSPLGRRLFHPLGRPLALSATAALSSTRRPLASSLGGLATHHLPASASAYERRARGVVAFALLASFAPDFFGGRLLHFFFPPIPSRSSRSISSTEMRRRRPQGIVTTNPAAMAGASVRQVLTQSLFAACAIEKGACFGASRAADSASIAWRTSPSNVEVPTPRIAAETIRESISACFSRVSPGALLALFAACASAVPRVAHRGQGVEISRSPPPPASPRPTASS